ncbi:MAG TPA: hypothetical protein DFR83_01895 [Deltaproteobacteria bacterium]|nr:hypothetical protein [Deltaproteobacteria bacterium]
MSRLGSIMSPNRNGRVLNRGCAPFRMHPCEMPSAAGMSLSVSVFPTISGHRRSMEVASDVAVCGSDAARSIHGAVLPVDTGWLLD